jgi:hypothetical protein
MIHKIEAAMPLTHGLSAVRTKTLWGTILRTLNRVMMIVTQYLCLYGLTFRSDECRSQAGAHGQSLKYT